MAWIGLALLALALLLMMCSGWPTYAVLLGVSTLGATLGVSLGVFDVNLLGSLPGRVIGLLEHDLLQALALYALVGALMNRLALAGSLFGGLSKALGALPAASRAELAGMGLGSLMAPMNGSVSASLLALSRATAQAWDDAGVNTPRRIGLLAVFSTLGVIVPPSLVLLLLGDAMLRAHTEGLNIARSLALPLAQQDIRVISTQDIMQAVLLPAALLLLGWLLIIWLTRERSSGARASTQSSVRLVWQKNERWALAIVPLSIVGLLTLVAMGQVRAVEAAAAAGVALLVWGWASRQLSRKVMREVLDDAMVLTGALFALLLAATTFSLLLRAFGTDALVTHAMLALQGHPMWALMAVLAMLLATSFVLDAFELIFLVVPIVMPPLLAQVGDAAWVAALTLLVLQLGFLLPPFGYAVVLAQAQNSPRIGAGTLLRALAPFMAWSAMVVVLVLMWPAVTQWLRTAPAAVQGETLSNDAVEKAMREMSRKP